MWRALSATHGTAGRLKYWIPFNSAVATAITSPLYLIEIDSARVCNEFIDTRARECRRSVYSGDFDFNLFGLGVLALCHMYCEHAIFELGVYFVEIGIVGQGEAAHEGAVAAFDAVIFLFLLFFLKLAFPGDGQHAIFDRDLYVFFFHIRQFGLNDIFLIILGDVRKWRPFRQSNLFPTIPAAQRSAEKR